MLRDWLVDVCMTALALYALLVLMAAFIDWRP